MVAVIKQQPFYTINVEPKTSNYEKVCYYFIYYFGCECF